MNIFRYLLSTFTTLASSIFYSFLVLLFFLLPYCMLIQYIFSHVALHAGIVLAITIAISYCAKHVTLKRIRNVISSRNPIAIGVLPFLVGFFCFVLAIFIIFGLILPFPSPKCEFSATSFSKFLHWPITVHYSTIGYSPSPGVNVLYYCTDAILFGIGIGAYSFVHFVWPWSSSDKDWLPLYKFNQCISLKHFINGDGTIANVAVHDLLHSDAVTDRSREAFCKLYIYTDYPSGTDGYLGVVFCIQEIPYESSSNRSRYSQSLRYLEKIDRNSLLLLEERFGPLIRSKEFFIWPQIKKTE